MTAMPARSVALLVLVTAVWGVNFVVIHEGLEHFPPLLFNALRFTFMAVPAIFLVGRPQVPWRIVIAFGFLLGVVKFGLLFISLDLGMPAGLSSLLLQLQVVFTIGFAAVILHERPRREQVIGAGIAFAGLVVIGVDRAAAAPILPFLLDPRRRGGLGRDEPDHAGRAAARPARDARVGEPRPAAPAARPVAAVRGPGRDRRRARGHRPGRRSASLLFVACAAGLFGFAAWTRCSSATPPPRSRRSRCWSRCSGSRAPRSRWASARAGSSWAARR